MQISELPKIKTRTKRRLGQGHGSGRVKTSGRGTKGQKARRSIPLAFEGGALSLIKRMPFLRGKGKLKSLHNETVVVTLTQLNSLPKNSTIDEKTLVKHGIIKSGAFLRIKILGTGEITNPLSVKLPLSKAAAEKIQAAGGTIA